MIIDALLFDFGGTIDTDGVHWNEEFRRAYRNAGVAVGDGELDRAYVAAEQRMSPGVVGEHDGLRKTVELQVALQFDELRAHDATRHAIEGFTPAMVADFCMRDVASALQRNRPILHDLSRDFHLGLVSNFYGNLAAVCRELELGDMFEAVIDSACTGLRKPDPAIFALALDSLRVSPARCAVVGDSYDRDIVPAKELGCATIWLQGASWHAPAGTTSADRIIHSLMDLTSLLGKDIV